MSDVVLVNASNNDKAVDALNRKGYPLGIAYLSSSLQRSGHDTRMIDPYGRGLTNEQTVEKICESRPAIVGISATSFTLNNAIALAEGIKRQLPEARVVLGGYGPTLEDGFALQNPCVDIVVRGEGEQTTVELADVMRTGGDLRNVQGITYRNGSGIVSNPLRSLIKDLDSLPFPDRSEFSPAAYDPGVAEVYGSRGCPHACTFCDINKFYGRRYRSRSPENIVAEMSSLLDKYPDVRHVSFTDDSFLTDGNVLLGVHELIAEKRLPVKIGFQARSDDFLRNRQVLKKSRDSIKEVSLGFESMSQSQLDRWRKGTTVEDNRKAIDFIFNDFGPSSQNKLAIYLYFIMADPFTTVEELREATEGMTRYPYPWALGDVSMQMQYPQATKLHAEYPVDIRAFIRFMRHFESKKGDIMRLNHDGYAGFLAAARMPEINQIAREYMKRAIAISESAANKEKPVLNQKAKELIAWLDSEIKQMDKIPSPLDPFEDELFCYRFKDNEEFLLT